MSSNQGASAMRYVYLLVLLLLVVPVAIFAAQNLENTTIHFLNFEQPAPLALVIGVSYLVGMLSGWSVFGFLRRSIKRVTERPKENEK
jgi:uncharacterized integral membrane protein